MRDPLLVAAGQIHRRLANGSAGQDRPLCAAAANVMCAGRAMAAAWARREAARCHGWQGAGRRLTAEFFRLCRMLEAHLNALLARQDELTRPPPPAPSLRTIVEELHQLRDEFGDEGVEILPTGHRGDRRARGSGAVVTAHTGPIVLEGIDLGPFAIELHVRRLDTGGGAGGRPDARCFDVVPLAPNPAAGRSDVPHPHVSGRTLCAGDASAPIAAALAQGRVADAFLLVRSVLGTYNPHSAFVSLDQWEGGRCPDCDGRMHPDEACRCEACGTAVCEDCIGRCDGCGGRTCRACLERDDAARAELCPACRSTCARCGRAAANGAFDHAAGLCPECGGAAAADEPPDPPPPLNPNGDPHECDVDPDARAGHARGQAPAPGPSPAG